MSLAIDHIAVAAWKIDDVLPAWRRLGLRLVHTEEVAGYGVRVAFLELENGAHVEILEPMGEKTFITDFLERRGPGMHHLAFKVDDVAGRMAQLKGAGLELLSDAPKPGSRGTQVCFLHPKSTHGVLVELVEHPLTVMDPRD